MEVRFQPRTPETTTGARTQFYCFLIQSGGYLVYRDDENPLHFGAMVSSRLISKNEQRNIGCIRTANRDLVAGSSGEQDEILID